MENSVGNSALYVIGLGLVAIFVLLGGVILSVRAKRFNSKQALIASMLFYVELSGLIGIIIQFLVPSEVQNPLTEILMPNAIIFGLLAFLFLIAYMVENKRNLWLNLTRVIIFFIPVYVLSFALLNFPAPLTRLESIHDILPNIGKPDVILRLALLSLFYIYSFIGFFLPYDWHTCIVPKSVMLSYQVIMLVIPFTFTLGLQLGIEPIIPIHSALLVVIDIYILYIELKVRIPIKNNLDLSAAVVEPSPIVVASKSTSQFDSEEVWMNPDMTVVQLAKLLGTNQKYVLNQIKALGYAGYNDMINRKRVEYICKQLTLQGKAAQGDITQLMFEAGFRSRSTASSEFKRIKGCTPSEYLNSLG